jgi:rhodanese-related sulfurtransferase
MVWQTASRTFRIRTIATLAVSGLAAAAMTSAGETRMRTAVDPIDVPAEKQHLSQSYLTALEAARYLRVYRDVILIDVRSLKDATATGIARPVTRLIPLYSGGGTGFGTAPEISFSATFFSALARVALQRGGFRGRPEAMTLQLICVSGVHAAIAADHLRHAGYRSVFTILDGYDGDIGADGRRGSNGWRALGLPWSAQPSARQWPHAARL